jgi:L-amino acid N-acyltransferase
LRAGDYRKIREIERSGIDEYRRFLKETGEIDAVETSVTPPYFEHYLRLGSSFVSEVDGMIVGYILCQPTSFVHGRGRELWLEYMIVLSKHRGKGIGSMLLAGVVRWARRSNFNLLYTNLNPNNSESAGLLRKYGFEVRNWLTAQINLN